MNGVQRPDLVIRVKYDGHDRDEEKARENITAVLERLGFRVMSVQPPMLLNPEPLRVRKNDE